VVATMPVDCFRCRNIFALPNAAPRPWPSRSGARRCAGARGTGHGRAGAQGAGHRGVSWRLRLIPGRLHPIQVRCWALCGLLVAAGAKLTNLHLSSAPVPPWRLRPVPPPSPPATALEPRRRCRRAGPPAGPPDRRPDPGAGSSAVRRRALGPPLTPPAQGPRRDSRRGRLQGGACWSGAGRGGEERDSRRGIVRGGAERGRVRGGAGRGGVEVGASTTAWKRLCHLWQAAQ